MKKILAMILALSASAMIFASCGNTEETTTASTTPAETTTAAETTSGNTTETTTAETTTAETTTVDTTRISLDADILDTYEHDYTIKKVRNVDTNEVIGVAVCFWDYNKVIPDIVFDEVFTYRNSVGEQFSYPVVHVGYGQGFITFQHSVVESVSIPSTVKKIYENAFSACPNLKTLTLAEGLEEIGQMAFWFCTSLESVVIPSSVTTIGANAFADCVNLKSVTLPRSFESQVDAIFAGCSADIVFNYVD